MKCSLCDRYVDRTFTFNNLFNLEYVCEECLKILDIKEVLIPISEGYIMHYFYATDTNNYFPYKRVIEPLIKLLKSIRKKTFIFIDNETLSILDYLVFFEDLYAFSYRYQELENYIIFNDNEI